MLIAFIVVVALILLVIGKDWKYVHDRQRQIEAQAKDRMLHPARRTLNDVPVKESSGFRSW